MARKNRRDLRQKRAEQKRAERLSSVPDMLADERALRDSVDALYQRSKKIGRHLEYDRAIKTLVDQNSSLSEELPREMKQVENLMASTLGDPTASSTPEWQESARGRLAALEALGRSYAAVVGEVADLVVKRAELGTVPVDREEVANGIERMLAHYETIEAGIDRNRQWILTELARRGSADA